MANSFKGNSNSGTNFSLYQIAIPPKNPLKFWFLHKHVQWKIPNPISDKPNHSIDKQRSYFQQETDAWTQPHTVIVQETRDMMLLKKRHDLVCSETRQLVAELRTYEEKLGYPLPEFEQVLREGQQDVYNMMGIQAPSSAPIIRDLGFDYFSPLIVAYQKKIEFLEFHLKDRYQQMIKLDGDVKTQADLQ